MPLPIAEDCRRQAERLVHRQGGEADVHSVEVGGEVADHEQRDQPSPDPAHRL